MALMIEAARTSETLVNFYQTTRRYNPEYRHLRTHRRENLKPNLTEVMSCMLKEISRMAFIVTSVPKFNNFIPTLTKLEAFTFLNDIVINCHSTKKLPYKGICYK
jgi:hypothetical protein